MVAMEECIRKLLNAYSQENLKGAPPDTVHKTRCRTAIRIGEILISAQRRCKWREEFAHIEELARKKFTKSLLVEHVVQLGAAGSPPMDAAACSQMLPSQVDSKPALAFDESGEVQEDLAAIARGMGLAIGSNCVLMRSSRGLERMRVGTILKFVKKDATVRWWTQGEQPEEEKDVPLSFVKLYCAKNHATKPLGADKDGQQPVEEVKLPPCLEWNCYSESTLDAILRQALLAFGNQLAIQRAPHHDDVGILEEPRILIAKRELQPLSLQIVPTASNLKQCAKPKARSRTAVDWRLKIEGSPEDKCFTREGVSASLGAQDGSTLVLDFAAFLAASSQEAAVYAGGCVKLEVVESGDLAISVGQYATEDENFKLTKKMKAGGAMHLSARCHYWTNTVAIARGAAIAAPD
jgi:hypothetical protein